MSHDDEVCLNLGREVVRMIRDLHKQTGSDVGYLRRTLTFPGGSVDLLVATDRTVSQAMERGVAEHFDVADKRPESEIM